VAACTNSASLRLYETKTEAGGLSSIDLTAEIERATRNFLDDKDARVRQEDHGSGEAGRSRLSLKSLHITSYVLMSEGEVCASLRSSTEYEPSAISFYIQAILAWTLSVRFIWSDYYISCSF
jgi:hypothetical protein